MVAPIHLAVHAGSLAEVESILQANPAQANAKTDRDARTPLHMAAIKGDEAIVRALLLRGARVQELDHEGLSPLYAASHKGHIGVVRVLLDHGANPIQALRGGNSTALGRAAAMGHAEVVGIYLRALSVTDQSNVAANEAQYQKNLAYALTQACRFGNHVIVRMLLSFGADWTLGGFHSTAAAAARRGALGPERAACIAEIDGALRVYLLHRLRRMQDDLQTNRKRRPAQPPPYLESRIRRGKALPRVVYKDAWSMGTHKRRRRSETPGENRAELWAEALRWTLMSIPKEMFVELMRFLG